MFKTFFTTVLVLFCMPLLAQNFSILGIVSDAETKQSLSGATVQLGAKAITVTDNAGGFSFANLAPGDYTLTIKFVGYATQMQQISLQNNVELRISLEESAVLTDEVIVFATRATDKTPTTFTNVNQQAIEKQNFGQDLPFILNWSPSVVTT